MTRKLRMRMIAGVLALWCAVGVTPAATAGRQDGDTTLELTGCLLLSRRVDVYALHMEYNRVAVVGHADLVNHIGHIVTLTGFFETVGNQLQFVAEDVSHISPTCEVQARAPRDQPATEISRHAA